MINNTIDPHPSLHREDQSCDNLIKRMSSLLKLYFELTLWSQGYVTIAIFEKLNEAMKSTVVE